LNTVDQERAGLLLLVDGIAFRRIRPRKSRPKAAFRFFFAGSAPVQTAG
jgi:hypothetical protein